LAGIHALWDASKAESQVWQVATLMKHVEEIKAVYENMANVRSIIAGDFNAEAHRASISYLTTRSLAHWSSVNGTRLNMPCLESASHSINLQSCYSSYVTLHPSHVSCVESDFCGVIDHIFIDGDSLLCAAVGELDDRREVPNANVPSDHYPVCAVVIPAL
jgi:mRNA deadenylase 3'-5' endonuclease subunit Ccr4